MSLAHELPKNKNKRGTFGFADDGDQGLIVLGAASIDTWTAKLPAHFPHSATER